MDLLDGKIKIKHVDGFDQSHGNGMFAEQTFKPQAGVCHIAKPLLAALDTARLQDTCYHCYKQPRGTFEVKVKQSRGRAKSEPDSALLLLCTQCRTVRYCSRACQKTSWKDVHIFECKLFARVSPRVFPNHMRAVVAFIRLRDHGRITDELWSDFEACPSHIDKFKDPRNPDYLMMMQLAQATKEYTETTLTTNEVLEIYCRLKINSITLMTGWFDPIGVALHPLLAKINHSCNPNSYIRFSPVHGSGSIAVTALRPISKDEEITICYVEENYPYRLRQKELQDRYFFTCRCDKCEKKRIDIGSDARYHGIAARRQVLEEQIMKYVNNADAATKSSTSIHNLRYAMHLLTTYDQMGEQGWQRSRYPYPLVLQKLVVAYIDDRQFGLALVCAAIQHFDVDPEVYSQPTHPLRSVHLCVLLRLILTTHHLSNEDQTHQALDLRPYSLDILWWRGYLDRAMEDNFGGVPDEEQHGVEMSKMRKLMADMYTRMADKRVWDT